MRLLILTTQTPHHVYFVKRLKQFNPLVISEESMRIKKDFDHKFFQERIEIEKNHWFDGKSVNFEEISNTFYTKNINDQITLKQIEQFDPQLTICFGTRILESKLISKFNKKIFNLHGGNPEEYRGLDSHFWSLYHNDINGLVSCLHLLTENVDCGPIVFLEKINLQKVRKLEYLQIENTNMCVNISLNLIKAYGGLIKYFEQKQKGRYYSKLPACLIEKCQKNFLKIKVK